MCRCFYISWLHLFLLLLCSWKKVTFSYNVVRIMHHLFYFRRFHFIRTLQMNVMDLWLQFFFCNLILFRAFLDQALNIFFQIYYKELGKDDVFQIWWLSFYLENIGWQVEGLVCQKFIFILGLRTLFNLKVYFDAKRRLPEFSGLQGRRYPGQPAPLPYIVTPRRPHPPPGHQHQGSIGARRTKPINIIVIPAIEDWVDNQKWEL